MRNIMVGLQVRRLLGNTFRDKIVHRTGDITRRILLQTRDDQILFINNTPIVQTLLAVEDFHQGRFAGAVTPYQADAFVIFDMQFSVIQQRRIAERKPGAVHTNQ